MAVDSLSAVRVPPSVAVLACAAITAGCGSSEPTPEDQVRSVLATFATATERHDYATLCDKVLAPRLLSGLQQIGLPCEVALRNSLGRVIKPRLSVGRVTVNGRTATAQVKTSAQNEPPSSDTVELVKVGGRWRISALGASRTK
jgi:hypothetical protein